MLERLVTQMYFPDDPLLGYDPIFNSVIHNTLAYGVAEQGIRRPEERMRVLAVSNLAIDHRELCIS